MKVQWSSGKLNIFLPYIDNDYSFEIDDWHRDWNMERDCTNFWIQAL